MDEKATDAAHSAPGSPLQEARQRRAAAASALARAEETYRRAIAAHRAAEEQAARFSDLEQRAAQATADSIKVGAATVLPPAIATEMKERRGAQEQIGLSAGALRLLKSERDTAEKELTGATAALSERAFEVLLTEAASLATELKAAKERSWELADSLTGFELLVSGSAPGIIGGVAARVPVGLAKILNGLRAERPYVPSLIAASRQRSVAMWRARHAELVDFQSS